MSVRRGRATVRLSAGLLLTAACALGPAAAQAAPVPADNGPQAACAPDAAAHASVDASTITLGNTVTITGTCFGSRQNATINIVTPAGPVLLEGDETNSDGSVTWVFTPESEGAFSAVISTKQLQADVAFTVDAEEEPEPSPDPEPTPTPEPTPEPTPDPGPAPGPTGSPTNEQTDPPAEEPSEPEPTDSSSTPQDPAPSASGDPDASAQPPSAAPSAPGPATNDFPAATPEPSDEQQESARLAASITSLFAHGVSGGEVGTSPEDVELPGGSGDAEDGSSTSGEDGSDGGVDGGDGGDGEASDDGGEELANTGTNVAAPAAGAALALAGGTGALWYQRRRSSLELGRHGTPSGGASLARLRR
ncbi:Exopolysaccharide biosynthesis domain protein [Brachybacterium faecium]|nr:Exopolysaccharide biosynthesis domain protein [Brachybacterium faecium]